MAVRPAHRTSDRASKPASAPKPPAVAPAWLKPVVMALAVFLQFSWFTREVADTDSWWHLKTGQYIVQYHKLPVPDPFAFTTALAHDAYPGESMVRHFNLTHEWLSQIIFYLMYAGGGFPLMVLFRGALLVGICAFPGLVVYYRTGGYYRAVAAAVAVGSVAYNYSSDRPFLFSFLLLGAVIFILERRRWLWMLPPLFLFWANCHGGYFLGWSALGAYSFDALVARRRGKPQAQERGIWIASAVSIAASALNPNFFDALRVMQLYRASAMQRSLWEWQHTALWPLEPYQLMLFGSAIAMLIAWRRVRVSDWILYPAYAFASFWAVRNVMLIAMLGPILLATYIPWKRALPAIAEWAMAGAALVAIGIQLSQGGGFHLRAAQWYPWGAAKFLEDHHITSPMFNTYDYGGFLIWRLWPQERVFVDGRALSDEIFQDFRYIAYNAAGVPGKDSRELLDKYHIETIVMNGFEYTSGQVMLLAAALSDPAQKDWKLVYEDNVAAVFMRHPPPGVQPLPNQYALVSMGQQCQNHIAHDPYHPRCARGMSELFLRIGDQAQARQWMAYYLNHKAAPDPEAEQMFARMMGR
jgi:hypothetical protein